MMPIVGGITAFLTRRWSTVPSFSGIGRARPGTGVTGPRLRPLETGGLPTRPDLPEGAAPSVGDSPADPVAAALAALVGAVFPVAVAVGSAVGPVGVAFPAAAGEAALAGALEAAALEAVVAAGSAVTERRDRDVF